MLLKVKVGDKMLTLAKDFGVVDCKAISLKNPQHYLATPVLLPADAPIQTPELWTTEKLSRTLNLHLGDGRRTQSKSKKLRLEILPVSMLTNGR